jgi:predicted ATPase
LRYLFLLAVLGDPNPPSVIAIDEPEIGLHPSMLPVIAEYAKVASQRTQVILTTHSPDFLNAFSEMSPQVTVCHWEEGETSLHALEPHDVASWLEHYRLGELFTRGALDLLALPKLEPLPDFAERFADFRSESETAETSAQ